MESINPTVPTDPLLPKRDGHLRSLWQGSAEVFTPKPVPADSEHIVWDVIVVGGGITGVTTALRLQEQGMRCLILEAQEIGFGTTGGTTAHINTMLDVPYNTLQRHFGTAGAQLVAEATREGRDLIASNVATYGIDCDFAYKDGILFAEDDAESDTLKEILDASIQAGVDVAEVSGVPLPLHARKAISYRKQAQMHPLRYLHALAQALESAGGSIMHTATVIDATPRDGVHHVELEGGTILKARHMVYATHIPLGINILHFRCAPYRSYVLAAQVDPAQYPDALAYDMKEPYHYFRTEETEGKRYLILGGADHKTGQGDPLASFRELESYLHKHFTVSSVDYQWSSQFFDSTDGLPYIGHLPGGSDDTYVATGFGGNGILFGSFSAILLSDLILKRESPYEQLFSPKRVKPLAGFASFVKENANVAYRFLADRFRVEELENLIELPSGTGTVVRVDKRKIALYKSPTHAISALSPVCTHAGCIVAWNDAEKTWDCPCHGGRYSVYGEVLTGPPRKPLEKISLLD